MALSSRWHRYVVSLWSRLTWIKATHFFDARRSHVFIQPRELNSTRGMLADETQTFLARAGATTVALAYSARRLRRLGTSRRNPPLQLSL